jgi:BioD-like phosphotransacetylase family protein
MARKVFVAATGQNCGKTTTSLSLLHRARKQYSRVGFIKPVGPKPTTFQGLDMDKDAALMAQVYGLEEDIEFMSPVVLHAGTTREVLDGRLDPEILREKIRRACAELERKCDFLIIEGAGHSGVGSVIGLSNAAVARMLDAPALVVAGGGVGNVVDAVAMNLALYRQEGAEVRMVMTNKVLPEKREAVLRYLGLAFRDRDFRFVGGFNYSPILANPTLNRVSRVLNLPLQGNQADGTRIIHHVQLGAASTQRVSDLLQESTLLIVTSSRDELLVMLASLYQIPEYRPKIAGLVIPGIAPVSRITQLILDRSNIPYLRTDATTSEVFSAITEDVSKISPEDQEKISLIQRLAETELDFAAINELF